MMTRNECAAYLGAHDSYCILTHARPDGDTVGSASALCLGLRALGKTAHVLENPEMPPYLAPCLAGLTKKQAADGDTVVAVDVAAPEMLPDAYKYLLPRCGLRIDHHGSSTGFTPHALVDPAAAACGEIVYDLLVLLGLSLDREMAKRLYIAVSTDTGDASAMPIPPPTPTAWRRPVPRRARSFTRSRQSCLTRIRCRS